MKRNSLKFLALITSSHFVSCNKNEDNPTQGIKTRALLMVSLLLVFVFTACEKNTEDEIVQLTMSSWRMEDVAEMNRINALFSETHPNISIQFTPVNPGDYDELTLNELASENGADILFLRSYDKGRELYDAGYLYDLTTIIPNLNSYSPIAVKAWSTEGGITYGVPSVGVTHGIYYQKAVFEKYNLQEPTNWTEFIMICETLFNEGETVFAQGAYDSWTMYEVVFSGLGANFYGGETARQALMSGEKKLTDPDFIEAFKMVNSLKKYLPGNFAELDYSAMKQMFGSGNAAMFIGGSWEISEFEELGSNSSQIDWFAPPVVTDGDKLQYCFHVDAGIGVNKKCKNIEAALIYIKWISGSEYAQAIMDELPGFFSYTPGNVYLSNPMAKKMFDASATADITVRLMCEKLSTQLPSGSKLMSEVLNEMMLGNYTPETASAYVQNELDKWYLSGK